MGLPLSPSMGHKTPLLLLKTQDYLLCLRPHPVAMAKIVQARIVATAMGGLVHKFDFNQPLVGEEQQLV